MAACFSLPKYQELFNFASKPKNRMFHFASKPKNRICSACFHQRKAVTFPCNELIIRIVTYIGFQQFEFTPSNFHDRSSFAWRHRIATHTNPWKWSRSYSVLSCWHFGLVLNWRVQEQIVPFLVGLRQWYPSMDSSPSLAALAVVHFSSSLVCILPRSANRYSA